MKEGHEGRGLESRHTAIAIVRTVSSESLTLFCLVVATLSEPHPRAALTACAQGLCQGERGHAGVLQSFTLTLVKDFSQPELRSLSFPTTPDWL